MSKRHGSAYWVGVLKDRWEGHDVFQQADAKRITPSRYPNYDYVLGPFKTKADAEDRAKSEHNKTGMFTDPYCNHGGGR